MSNKEVPSNLSAIKEKIPLETESQNDFVTISIDVQKPESVIVSTAPNSAVGKKIIELPLDSDLTSSTNPLLQVNKSTI